MFRPLSFVRSFLGDDRATAAVAEDRRLQQALDAPTLDPRFVRELHDGERAPGRSIVIGNPVEAPEYSVRLPLREVAGSGHGIILGATNSGKTYASIAIARGVLEANAAAPDAIGLAVLDHKGDQAELTRAAIADLLDRLPRAQARALLDRVVVLNPFSEDALVPMQVLEPEPGLAPEIQAYDTTTVINRVGGELGVQQEQYVYNACLLGVVNGLSLPELLRLSYDPPALAACAARCPHADVRAFFANERRLSATSLQGVQARLSRLLRLPSARLALGARGNVSFHDLLASKILIIDVGSPPAGCEDIARFWAGLYTLRLVRGIFARTVAEARRPVACFIDEWQEGLLAGGDIAEHYERVLQMARSRGVSFWLASQSFAGASRVSATLPRVVQTNTKVQLWFASSAEDARMMTALPVTGRKPRPPSEPWEERRGSPFLSADAEREALRDSLTTLPARTFLYWNRNRPYRAQFVRTTDLRLPDVDALRPRLKERLRVGVLARPIPELAREVETRPPADAPAEPEAVRDLFRPRAPAVAAAPAAVLRGPTRQPRRGR